MEENPSLAPDHYVLEQNYPNPFNAETVIPFYLPRMDYVTLRVLDILGREVDVLLDRTMEKGEHSVTLQGNHLASGLYIVRMETTGLVQSRVMELVK